MHKCLILFCTFFTIHIAFAGNPYTPTHQLAWPIIKGHLSDPSQFQPGEPVTAYFLLWDKNGGGQIDFAETVGELWNEGKITNVNALPSLNEVFLTGPVEVILALATHRNVKLVDSDQQNPNPFQLRRWVTAPICILSSLSLPELRLAGPNEPGNSTYSPGIEIIGGSGTGIPMPGDGTFLVNGLVSCGYRARLRAIENKGPCQKIL